LPALTAYRHFHEESNLAAVAVVALAEFGVAEFDPEARGQELMLHGTLQRGRFLEGRGLPIANAMRHFSKHGVIWQILHDQNRTAALQQRLIRERPDFDFQLLNDLASPQPFPLRVERDLAEGQALILVEARPALGRLPLHMLLLRRHEDQIQIMNSDTGENHPCSVEQLERHLNCPVSFGANAFAGRLYLFSGLAISLRR
jgi:hypothetical protein